MAAYIVAVALVIFAIAFAWTALTIVITIGGIDFLRAFF
jgi:hypothetical protein